MREGLNICGVPFGLEQTVRVKCGCRGPGQYRDEPWHTLRVFSINGLRVQELKVSPQTWGQAKGLESSRTLGDTYCAILKASVKDSGGSKRGLMEEGTR